MRQNATEENRKQIKEVRNLANSIVRRQKRLEKKKAIEDIANYKIIYKLFFKQHELIKEGYKLQNFTMVDDDGNLVIQTITVKQFKGNKSAHSIIMQITL